MRSVVVRLSGLVLLCVALAACENPNSTLHVDVQTDLVPELELAALEVEVVRDGSLVVARVGPIMPEREQAAQFLSGGVRVATLEPLAAGTYTVRVAGREAAAPGLPLDGGPILVQTRVLVSLRPGTSRVVRVILGARCADRACPDGDDPELTACLNGRCVRPTCDVTAGEVCDDRAPCVAGDPEGCSMPPDCATAICRDGACLNEPTPGACPDGEYCGRDGCVPDPDVMIADAGLPDAWIAVPDAYVAPPPDASGPCGPIDTPCDDGNPCTGTDVCNATGCAGTPLTGLACGTRDACRMDTCQMGVCTRVNATNGTACGSGGACTNSFCSSGVCSPQPVRDGTACTYGDSNPCTSGECRSGTCARVARPDGTGCGSGNICCSSSCINPDTNGSHCGVCGLSCGGRGCHEGLCRCTSNSQCTGEYGSAATCWDSSNSSEPAGMHCQCQCGGAGTCAACPGAARCREIASYRYNRCYYP